EQRPDRGTDHQAQAAQTPDVRPRLYRLASQTSHSSSLTAVIETEQEPNLARIFPEGPVQLAYPAAETLPGGPTIRGVGLLTLSDGRTVDFCAPPDKACNPNAPGHP